MYTISCSYLLSFLLFSPCYLYSTTIRCTHIFKEEKKYENLIFHNNIYRADRARSFFLFIYYFIFVWVCSENAIYSFDRRLFSRFGCAMSLHRSLLVRKKRIIVDENFEILLAIFFLTYDKTKFYVQERHASISVKVLLTNCFYVKKCFQ